MFATIRKGEVVNDGVSAALSTMMAIAGRMAAYSGKELEWDAALNSKIEIFPKTLAWDADPGPKPGENGDRARPTPGRATRFDAHVQTLALKKGRVKYRLPVAPALALPPLSLPPASVPAVSANW